MPQRCIIPGCYDKTNYFHVFKAPKDFDRREMWLKAVLDVYPNLDIGGNFCVCRKHFRKTDFTSYILDESGKIIQEVSMERKRLKHEAVPHFDMLNMDSDNNSMKTILTEGDEPSASTSSVLTPQDIIGAGSSTSMPLKVESATNIAYRWMDGFGYFLPFINYINGC